MARLDGKVAVITGGAGGIGRAAGARFVGEGANVLLVDLDAAALEEACEAISDEKVSSYVADVTSASDNRAMIETATQRYGGVDIFVANAGIEGRVAPSSAPSSRDQDSSDAIESRSDFPDGDNTARDV